MIAKSAAGPESEAEVKKELNWSRFRLGMANLFFSGEESSLAGLKIMIVRLLGGHDVHIGAISSFGAVVNFTQWLAVPLLNRCRSNRRALAIMLGAGAAIGVLLAFSVLGADNRARPEIPLYLFLGSTLLMSIATGIQLTIEANWIGDLVPVRLRGWFTSVKTSVSLVGMSILGLIFGFLVDHSASLSGAAFRLYWVVVLSHLLAIMLVLRIPDRTPQPATLFHWRKSAPDQRIELRSRPLWCYIGFYVSWTAGRGLLNAFVSIFLIESFGMGLLQLSGLNLINQAISIGLLLFLGQVTDRHGNRRALMWLSVAVGAAMLLWLATPWLGLTAIIVFYVINSMAGATHTMLVVNYGLEIYPEKGRSLYLALTRMIIGAASLLTINLAGIAARQMELANWSFTLFGAEMSRYQLLFGIGALLATASVLPLFFTGERRTGTQ